MYLLATDIVSNVLYHPQTFPYLVQKVKTVNHSLIYVSIVTAQELVDRRLQALQKHNQNFSEIVQHYAYLEEVLKDVSRFQRLSYREAEYREFEKIPKNLRCAIYDKRIAATALANNLILVTTSAQGFRDIPNLRIEVWTHPLE